MLLFLMMMMMVAVEAYQYHKEVYGDYVLEMKADCPTTPTGSLPVLILTDLNLLVRAYCKDNYTTLVHSRDEVNFDFDPLFRGNSREECVLNKNTDSNTYILHVDLEYGEPESRVRPIVEPYVITCAYDPHSTRTSNEQGIGRSLIAPKEIQANEGKHGASRLKLRVVNIMGKSTPRQMKRGHLVRLAASSDGAGGETGLRATACDAVGNNGVHYAVLRAGCGDGIVFKQTEGFTTKGLNVYSPFFRIFNLKNSISLRFECNYTLCTSNCNGSSCVNQAARSQRSPDGMYASGHVIAVSDVLEMQDEGQVDQRESGDVDRVGVDRVGVDREDVANDDVDVNYHSLRNTGLSPNTASDNPWWQTPVVILTMAILLTVLMGGSALLMHRRRMTSVSLA
ncbi:LOW QUALITY PROTEIN: vitelline envelope sperm lysin receptor-like [Haliotis rubra]|uniref:LOW QUALITY PROTEIN: vitelline envelope sperm lysin receptor-like n=1 Tax=Haliotis rubra TaxID=36100 RepID=UPI001EE52D87|nr:LOW QUALITY PROTEIN: vitelline envelope sperm lysin receptor-like [Haliotis rubra]